jgi:hypothetical protein
MKFARAVFGIAGVYGLLAVTPLYLLEKRISLEQPPAITHPEFFYGFVGVTLAWQVAFLIIARDPVRFRPLMWAAMIEKFSYVIAATWLWSGGRLAAPIRPFMFVDLIFGVLFVIAYIRTGNVKWAH